MHTYSRFCPRCKYPSSNATQEKFNSIDVSGNSKELKPTLTNLALAIDNNSKFEGKIKLKTPKISGTSDRGSNS